MKRLIEIIEYEHRGVKVGIKINHIKGEISVVETLRAKRTSDFKDKQWMFSSRRLEYIRGWSDILSAIDYAIGEAKKVLDEDEKEKTDEAIKRAEMIYKLEDEENGK